MESDAQRGDVETAAAWLRGLGWGDSAPAGPPAPGPPVAGAQDGSLAGEEVDSACWPALVAPFYD